MDRMLDEARASTSSPPEEVIWIVSTAIAFVLPWLADWDMVAFLAGGFVFAVWGGTVVLKMGSHLHANGVHLNEDVFSVVVLFSWVTVLFLLIRFGSRAMYARK